MKKSTDNCPYFQGYLKAKLVTMNRNMPITMFETEDSLNIS